MCFDVNADAFAARAEHLLKKRAGLAIADGNAIDARSRSDAIRRVGEPRLISIHHVIDLQVFLDPLQLHLARQFAHSLQTDAAQNVAAGRRIT